MTEVPQKHAVVDVPEHVLIPTFLCPQKGVRMELRINPTTSFAFRGGDNRVCIQVQKEVNVIGTRCVEKHAEAIECRGCLKVWLCSTNRFQLIIEVDACDADGSVLMPMHVCPLLVAVASDVEERSVYDPVFVLFLVQRALFLAAYMQP